MKSRKILTLLTLTCLFGCGGNSMLGRNTEVFASPDVNKIPDLGPNASLHGKPVFPSNDPWNTPVDKLSVDPNSANLIASIGLSTGLHPDFGANWNGGPFGIPYVVVAGTQKKVSMTFDYAGESDPGPYPYPANAPIEGGANSTGDRHVLVVDRDNWKLYESWDSHPKSNGSWHCGSGAKFDLVTDTVRPSGWTSADAAGLPIFPGLVRYDEVSAGAINHAIRFTVAHSRKAFVAPARHFASNLTGTNYPPMGMRVRLKASFDTSKFAPQAKVILTAM